MDTSDTKSLDFIEFRDYDYPPFEDFSPFEDFTDRLPQSEATNDESVTKLLKPSKKISRKKKVKAIARNNAEKLAPFFENWTKLRKNNKGLKKQMKLWFASYNMKLNKTYIYRDFFDSVRIHFRLAIKESCPISFDRLEGSDWQKMFVNLTNFLMDEINKAEEHLLKGKKSQVYPVWIESMSSFVVEKLPRDNNLFDFVEYWKQ